ncbi:MAG: hypothetical protein COB03_01455 [Alteromonas sp.]|jgi:hypothetical protein|uniref:hypothetical protein n=1 Tax=uncultured Alteromonas sp. TaxID=179113 RepID=UPI000C0E8515|nr:hypothetical protein [uncultured Alteromonas sp.]MBB66863.1 hypothetical protein [Rickettsiales bacterium]PHS59795.1 MAG: hypothetical protein COB03_01455 [Alteromonas sp.]
MSLLKFRSIAVMAIAFITVFPYIFLNFSILHGKSDPQLGIYIIKVILVAIVLFTGIFIFLNEISIDGIRENFRQLMFRFLKLTLFLSLTLLFSFTSFNQYSAFEDAANPLTSSERLLELEGFETDMGYEIDNLLAKNPSSPSELLQSLSEKEEQLGTLVALVSNKNVSINTLNRIASKISSQGGGSREILITSLKKNPRIVSGEYSFKELSSGKLVIFSGKEAHTLTLNR